MIPLPSKPTTTKASIRKSPPSNPKGNSPETSSFASPVDGTQDISANVATLNDINIIVQRRVDNIIKGVSGAGELSAW
jgi:hypothetical protein